MKLNPSYQFFLLFFGITLTFSAQNKQLRAFTLEDGLPQSQIYAMTQDYKGYLWLGTQGGGLARFDGEVFNVFNEKNGLASNYIYALSAANDTLYIGTKEGLSIKLKHNFQNIECPKVNKIVKIEKQVYLLTIKGVYKLNTEASLEKVMLHPEIDMSQVKDLLYYDNYFWIATQDGLWRFNDFNGVVNSIEKLERGDFTTLVGSKNKVYASTFNDGTIVLDAQNPDNQVLIREPLQINNSALLDDNQLWIASDSQGVSVLNMDNNSELFSLNTSNGLSVPNVKQVLQDRQSNIWLATSGGGLFKYFQNNFKHYNTETGLNGNRIYAVHHYNNTIWISNSENGLIRIDNLGIHNVDIPETFSDIKIKTIASDSKGNIWAGSDGRGLLFHGHIDIDSSRKDGFSALKNGIPKTLKISKILNTDTGFPFDWIRKIKVHHDTIYAATYSSGIVQFKYNAQQDKLTILKTFGKTEGIKDLNIKDMVFDNSNKLWYTTQNGHLGYLKNNTISHLGQVLNQSISLNSILFEKNTLFLGTAGNGIWWSNKDNFSTFKKLQGLKEGASNNIYQLIFDDQGYLWAGTERGVDKLQLDKDNVITDAFFFGRNEGFLGIETCLNAVDKDNRGHLWFGALYGLTEFQPFEGTQESKQPKLFLEDVKVAYNSVDTIDLGLWSNSNRVLQLTPDQRQVSFSFKTVDLDHPDGIGYRYRLNDNEWSPWTSNSTQDFSELNFGAHDFDVQSRNHRWKESDPQRFSFYIDSPLFQKPVFQAFIIGLITLIIVVLVLQYVKRLKRKNQNDKQRLQLENHLLSLEQKALRLQMNPHFIFNVLNGIKAMAPTKPDKMNETVNSFASLLRETLVNSRKDSISLDQEIKTLEHYIQVEQLMAEKPFTYEIVAKSEIDTEELLVPPMLIQPFVENAIRHGILKGPRPGELTVKFDSTEDTLKVTIQDNGIGIYHSQQQKTKTDHQSMALKVTRERLESISGKDALMIKEIKQQDGTIAGTTIVFEIPLETDY
ncbi:Two component regulator propeller [Formosa sp. Hel1_31_208]|nr:Two component regulator propeller [Formosa sp. Hel1_31_208]